MEKEIIFNGKKAIIEIKWGGNNYHVRNIKFDGVCKNIGYVCIPTNCMNDIEKIKPYIIETICPKKDNDLDAIEKWDGIL